MRILIIMLTIVSASYALTAQSDPFQIHLEPITIDSLPGLQAYAWGQHDGKWLVVGGRIDGLHRRQPWATFNPDGRNTQLYVVDPVHGKIRTAPLTSLSVPLQDQLSSTNMEFHQEGNFLYLVGGYGHSETVDSKVTYAMLTAIDVPGVMSAIEKGEIIKPYFRTMTDTRFAVTGGHLNKIYDTYYLVGGQKFDGNYNPMNHATFTQEYTNAIRTFKLEDDGSTLKVTHLATITDTLAFHRRDYNVAAQILHDGKEGLMSFSGPFQINADLPYLNVVSIDQEGYHIVPEFAQYFNNYHCAVMPAYASNAGQMHTVFFGGIAQYYVENGQLVQDSDVPFVKTIARVTRDVQGHMTEYKLPQEMPGYLGASAEFIPLASVAKYANGVIKLDELTGDTVHVGYIYGGIESTAANIFWINNGTESVAHPLVYKVYVTRSQTTALQEINAQSNNGLQMQIYPNPNEGIFNILFQLKNSSAVMLTITDEIGKVVLKEDLSDQTAVGFNSIEKKFKPFKIGGVYFVTLTTKETSATQKIIVKE
jgi:hypothetical protein